MLGGALRPRARTAIEPIARNGKSFFKFSLAAYSYRDLLNAKPPEKQADAGRFHRRLRQDGAGRHRADLVLLSRRSRRPSTCGTSSSFAFAWGSTSRARPWATTFAIRPGEKRDREITPREAVDRLCRDPGRAGDPHLLRPSARHERRRGPRLAVAGIEECCQYAGEHGVYLALENHGGLTTKAEGLLALVRDVKSPWFGVNLDTGNFHSADVYAEIAQLAPYAINVQVKVSVSGPDGKRQHGDFRRLARIMSDAGYRGYIVLEFEEPEDPLAACPRYVDEMRAAFTL